MNFEEYIEEYYENYEKNAEGQIKGTVKNFVETAIQDFLVQEGYGRENAKNFVEVITGNNQKIDYSHIIDINEDSKLFAKIADLKVFESISKLQDCNNLLNESLGTYQLCLDLDKQMQENGKCDPEDLKNLLSVILDSSINAVNAMPGSNIFAITAYQTTKSYIMDGAGTIYEKKTFKHSRSNRCRYQLVGLSISAVN